MMAKVKHCYVTACDGDAIFTFTSPQAPPCFVSDSCNAHIGDLLGNVVKVLFASTDTVTLQVVKDKTGAPLRVV